MFAKLKALPTRWRRRTTIHQLAGMNERLLSDIGIDRHELRLLAEGR
jgi:uncharacterized protein YjiS (DUF1127 family)